MPKIIVKDKKDMQWRPEWFLQHSDWDLHGQYDSLNFVDPNIEVLSVQFTKVGEKTYKAMPNLKWIVVRTHGFDNINLAECEKRGIGVLTTKPFTQSTADWITDKIDEKDKVLFVGYGAIAQKVLSSMSSTKNAFIVNTRTSKEQLVNFVEEANCMVVSMTPAGNDHYIDSDILKNFKGKIISVSRANVIDNDALLNNLDNISHAYIDTLDSKHRDELLESGKVTYTKHTAWSHNFSYETNPYYYGDLHDTLLHCLYDNVNELENKPILNRTERVTF